MPALSGHCGNTASWNEGKSIRSLRTLGAPAVRRSLVGRANCLPSTRSQSSMVTGLWPPYSTRSSLVYTHWCGLGVGSAALVAGAAGFRSWGSWRAISTAAPSTATRASPAAAATMRPWRARRRRNRS